MDNPEKLATLGTQDEETKQKHNTICVGHHYTQTNRNNGKMSTQYQMRNYTVELKQQKLVKLLYKNKGVGYNVSYAWRQQDLYNSIDVAT